MAEPTLCEAVEALDTTIAQPVPERVREIGEALYDAGAGDGVFFSFSLEERQVERDHLLEELAALCQPEPMSPPAPKEPGADWHDRADPAKCQASVNDGECWWRDCPIRTPEGEARYPLGCPLIGAGPIGDADD